MSESVTLERRGRVAHLRLNRPQARNAINSAVCRALIAYMDQLEADEGVGAIVISGAGDLAFSAGADLKEMRQFSDSKALRRFIELTWQAFERIAASPLPSIAALHGYVLGGGLELALACDMRVADASVQIGLPELTLGSVPGSGAIQRLPVLIGTAKTMELVITGRRMGSDEAHAERIVNSIVPTGSALEQALTWAELAAQRSPEALRYLKYALSQRQAGRTAAELHGLISDVCHSEKNYRHNTEKFVSSGRDASRET